MKEKGNLPELQNLMNDIMNWSDITFGEGPRTVPILYHLKKEVPEAIEAIGKSNYRADVGLMELADCFMLILDACSHYGINADEIIKATHKKLEINKKRKWGKPDENGVVKHIKQSNDARKGIGF